MHDFLSFPPGCAKGSSPDPGLFAGGRLRCPCTLHRPTIGGRHSPFNAREGGEHAAQFGVARFSGGSSPLSTRKWRVQGAPADEGGVPWNGPARGVGQGRHLAHLNPHITSDSN